MTLKTAPVLSSTALTIPDRFDRVPEIHGISPIARMLQSLTVEDVNALRDQYAKGTTWTEFKLYMLICAQRNLNPFANQIHCIVRGTGKNRKATIQTSIDGLRAIAGQYGKYAGSDDPIYGPMVDTTESPDGKKILNDVRHPEWCKVVTYTFGPDNIRVPHPAILYWDEFVPLQGDGWVDGKGYSGYKIPDTWRRMKRHMLAKCCEASSIRKGNPECGGIYLHEEMEQADFRDKDAAVTEQKAKHGTATVTPTPIRKPEPAPIQADADVVDGTFEDVPDEGDDDETPIPDRPMTSLEERLAARLSEYGIEADDLDAYLRMKLAAKPPQSVSLTDIMKGLDTDRGVLVSLYLARQQRITGLSIVKQWKIYLKEVGVDQKDIGGQLALLEDETLSLKTITRLEQLARSETASGK